LQQPELIKTIAKHLVSNKADIISGTTSIRYHRDCRITFCSSHYIAKCPKQTFAISVDQGGGKSACNIFTQSKCEVYNFDWKNNCFIFSERFFKNDRDSSSANKWSVAETVPASGCDATNMCETVLEATKERRD